MDGTKKKLVLAALQLFADQGLDGVSLRQVNSASGAMNASAAHYHFGGKEGLIVGIFEFISLEIVDFREKSNKEMQRLAAKDEPKIREILSAAYAPYLFLFMQPGHGRHCIKFLSRLQMDPEPKNQIPFHAFFAPLMIELLTHLQPMLPNKEPRELKVHLSFSLTSFLQGLAGVDLMANLPFEGLDDIGASNIFHFSDYFLDFISAGVGS